MKKLLSILAAAMLFMGLSAPASYAEGGELTRVYGAGRIETSVAISKATFPDAKTVIIASDQGFADALSGGPLAIQMGSPILLSSTELKSVVAREIKRLKTENIIILGGEAAVKKSVEDELKKNYKVNRISGSDRYKTGELIMEYQNALSGKKTERIGYATGMNFADALVAGPFIGKDGALQLQHPDEKLVNPPIVFGGTAALPKVENAKLRLYGDNRYDTAVKIANNFPQNGPYMPGQTVVIASGQNYPDALASAPLVNRYRSVLLLTEKSILPKSTANYLSSSYVKNIILLGGPNAISKEVESEIIKLKGIKTVIEIREDYQGPKTQETPIFPSTPEITKPITPLTPVAPVTEIPSI